MLKVGQRWRRRDGEVVSIAKDDLGDSDFPFECSNGISYRPDGSWNIFRGTDSELDLVQLIENSPSASTKTESPITKQHGGDHYRKLKIQPIQYIEANGLGFHEGNVLKYITRWKDKNGVEDLRKAAHYLELLIEHAQREKNHAHNRS